MAAGAVSRWLGWFAALALLLAAPISGAAQEAAGTISGSILDSERALPIEGARIVLLSDGAGALPGDEAAFIPGARVAVSGADGGYQFAGLPPGRYRLHVSRVGFRASTLGVELRGSADSRVSVSLSVQPIALAPVRIRGEAPEPFAPRVQDGPRADSARLAVERLRQRDYVSTDVRGLTRADVLEAVTLGESDVFRALHRLPGVATRDDYAAELWTRGAPWDQTRVYFDGVPLFNPLHGVGAFSGVSPNAVGAAWLHPGVLPASLGGAAAAVLDLRTRRATGDGKINGVADLSLVSASVGLDQRVMDGRGGWMLSARRTYLDWLAAGVARVRRDPNLRLPYSFSDVAGRADYRVGSSAVLEASGLMESDHVRGVVPDVVEGSDASWGNQAARVSLAAPLWRWGTRHTLSISRYGARVREISEDDGDDGGYDQPMLPPTRNRVRHLAITGEAEPRGGWSGGWQLARLGADYRGPSPVPQPRPEDRALFSPGRDLPVIAAWAERRWTPIAPLTLQAGLRAEGGERVRNGGPLRLAPRLSGRLQLGPELTVSAGVGRSWQYTQAVLPAGVELGSFQASYLWLLAGGRTPAVRADVATAGVEAWFGGGWIADANLYLRRSTGVAVAPPAPGLAAGAPLFAVAENHARGAEFSVRRLVGKWTASAGYTYATSELRADGYRYRAREDRRHTVDATTLARVLPSLRVGAAFTAASGGAFTRRLLGETVTDENGFLVDNPERGPPGAGTMGEYLSLDLLVDWMRRFGAWELGAYLQVRNITGHPNPASYTGSVSCERAGCGNRTEVIDHFERGLPTLPLIGFRARF